MELREFLREAAGRSPKPGLPILAFPAVQKLGVAVPELVKDGELQARAMELIARQTGTLAALGLMDLSVEAEAFGAQVNFLENEVPAITGQLVAGGEEAVHMVLEKATEYLIKYGAAMREAGADGLLRLLWPLLDVPAGCGGYKRARRKGARVPLGAGLPEHTPAGGQPGYRGYAGGRAGAREAQQGHRVRAEAGAAGGVPAPYLRRLPLLRYLRVAFSGPAPLDVLLKEAGAAAARPCGGHGRCGKCAVELWGEASAPNRAEIAAGSRLACQAVVLGDARVVVPDGQEDMRVELAGGPAGIEPADPMCGSTGAAVEIGTTTVAVSVYELGSGKLLGSAGGVNPQTAEAADVMGRIEAAMNGRGEAMRAQVAECIHRLLAEAAGKMPEVMVITGNTTMLYLLCGLSPEKLSHAPFTARELFGREWGFEGVPAYLPPCMNAFVGADVACAVLASGMCGRDEAALLCDIGTNGELALWKEGELFVTSTAAGPAFEGAGIAMGCGSVPGAIERVWAEGGGLRFSTIGGAEPVGICGSGIIDAVAAGLELGLIDDTGAVEEDIRLGPVALCQRDIRAVQLAKAAIAAGIDTLLGAAGSGLEELGCIYITGGFGSHLGLGSAVGIGLLPKGIEGRVRILGNGALAGAGAVLMDKKMMAELERIAGAAKHVELGGTAGFNERFVDNMLFE